MDRTALGLAIVVVVCIILAIAGWAMYGSSRHKNTNTFDAKFVRVMDGTLALAGDTSIDGVVIAGLKMPTTGSAKSITFRNVRFSSTGVEIFYTGSGLGRADESFVDSGGNVDNLRALTGVLSVNINDIKSFRVHLHDAYVPANETYTIVFKQ